MKQFLRAMLLLMLTGTVVSSFSASTSATLELSPLFTDHMVLQRGEEIPVWGTASAGDKVRVELLAESGSKTLMAQVSTTAGADGKWTAKLAAKRAGGPYRLTVRSDKASTGISDVLLGDVWLCSGQSNMGFKLSNDADATRTIPASKNPKLRFFEVPRAPSPAPRDEILPDAAWQVCDPENVGGLSAVAYYFGRELQKEQDVPVGLLVSAVGGTPAESWTSREALAAFPEFNDRVARIVKEAGDPEFARQRFEREMVAWNAEQEKLRSADAGTSRTRRRPAANAKKPMPEGSLRRPTVLYNGMIAPLVPFAIKGALWYQGESNAGRAEQYQTLFPAMIADWRKQWNAPVLPFIFVQLPFFHARKAEPADDTWSELREAQFMTARNVPATAMVVTVDTGDAKAIHPRKKLPVGQRASLAARALAYGEKVEWSGPLFTTATVEGAAIRVKFDHLAGGLSTSDKSGKLRGFAIGGADQKFRWANAHIDNDGKTVIVSSLDVPQPIAVRYAWAANPDANLCNKAGLPASPFRSDSWPGISHGNVKDSVPESE